MTKVKIFKDKSKGIDLSRFIDSRGLVCANSGGGKSYAIRKILEETHGKVMAIVLDVEGEFKTLREKFDFLLIGSNADVPLNLKSAPLLPRKLLELEVSTIIDISDLKMHDRITYVKKFLEALMEVPRDLWKPCIVVLDEAHLLAGQQEKQDSTHAVIDLMTRGRKRGFCGIICTQRISKLHKDAVAEANNYLVGRTGLDIDMKRASEILGFTNKRDMLSLRDLDAGEFYVFGTAISRKVEKVKVDLVKTTHPKVGMDVKSRIVAPTDKIKAMLSKLSDLPVEADAEIKTKSEMQQRIRELTAKLRVAEHSKPQTDERTIQAVKELAYKEAEKEFKKQFQELKHDYALIERKINSIRSIVDANIQKHEFEFKEKPPMKDSLSNLITSRVEPVIRPVEDTDAGDTNNKPMNLCERKIYSLLAQYPERGFTKAQIGVFTGYSQSSGSFNNAVSHLRTRNLLTGSGNDLRAKEVHHDLVHEFDFSKESIIQKLKKCEREIYNILLENTHQEFTKEELAESTPTHYSSNSGSFNNSISRLNTLGITKKEDGKIRLNPELLEI